MVRRKKKIIKFHTKQPGFEPRLWCGNAKVSFYLQLTGHVHVTLLQQESKALINLNLLQTGKQKYGCNGRVLTSTDILFSPYTDSPGTMFFVTNASSFPRAMNTPKTRVIENHHLNKKVVQLGLIESKPECCKNLETDVIDQLLHTI